MLSNTPSFLTNSLWTRCPGKRSLISIPKEKSNDNHAPYYVKKMFKKKVPVFLGLFVIFLLLRHVNTTNIFGTNPILDAAFKSASLKKLDHCFCEVRQFFLLIILIICYDS